MQPRTLQSLSGSLASNTPPSDRVTPVISLSDYSAGGLIHETRHDIDSSLRFGRMQQNQQYTCPAEWLDARVRSAVAAAELFPVKDLTVHVRTPTTALEHPEKIHACRKAVSGNTRLVTGICLVFEDAALVTSPLATIATIRSLRSLGFQIGLNAQTSWLSLRSPALLKLIDALCVNATHLEMDRELQNSLRDASAAGIHCIGFGGSWSRAATYQSAGLTHVFRAKVDA